MLIMNTGQRSKPVSDLLLKLVFHCNTGHFEIFFFCLWEWKNFPNPISLFIFKIYVNKPHQERVCPFLLLCAASGAMGPEAWQLGKPSPGMSPGPALWFLGAGDLPLDRGASGPMLTSTLPLQGPGWHHCCHEGLVRVILMWGFSSDSWMGFLLEVRTQEGPHPFNKQQYSYLPLSGTPSSS